MTKAKRSWSKVRPCATADGFPDSHGAEKGRLPAFSRRRTCNRLADRYGMGRVARVEKIAPWLDHGLLSAKRSLRRPRAAREPPAQIPPRRSRSERSRRARPPHRQRPSPGASPRPRPPCRRVLLPSCCTRPGRDLSDARPEFPARVGDRKDAILLPPRRRQSSRHALHPPRQNLMALSTRAERARNELSGPVIRSGPPAGISDTKSGPLAAALSRNLESSLASRSAMPKVAVASRDFRPADLRGKACRRSWP